MFLESAILDEENRDLGIQAKEVHFRKKVKLPQMVSHLNQQQDKVKRENTPLYFLPSWI